jgi:hypothetical protein
MASTNPVKLVAFASEARLLAAHFTMLWCAGIHSTVSAGDLDRVCGWSGK